MKNTKIRRKTKENTFFIHKHTFFLKIYESYPQFLLFPFVYNFLIPAYCSLSLTKVELVSLKNAFFASSVKCVLVV